MIGQFPLTALDRFRWKEVARARVYGRSVFHLATNSVNARSPFLWLLMTFFFLLAQSISRHIPTGYFFSSIFLVSRLNAHRVGQKRLTMRALLCGMNTSGLSFFRLRCSAVPLQAHLKKSWNRYSPNALFNASFFIECSRICSR